MRGHLGVVDLLLSKGGPSLLLAKDILNCTPVHLAAVQNQVTLIIRLVEALLEDEGGRTPLHEVARRRCMQVGAGGGGRQAGRRAVCCSHGLYSRELNCCAHSVCTRTTFPCCFPCCTGSDAAAPPPPMGLLLHTLLLCLPLHVRVLPLPRVQDFMGFLHLGWESATIEDDGSAPPLAELSPLWSIVSQVVDLKRPGLPTVQRVLGWHPLHVAAMSGACEGSPLCCCCGGGGCCCCCDGGGVTLVWWAWPESILRRPILVAGASLTQPSSLDSPPCTADHACHLPCPVAAPPAGNIELIQRLVQQFDCDLRVKSMNSWTPLHYAAAYNQVAAIEALVRLGCEVAVQDAVGSTPMHVAAGEGHLEAVRALVSLGCSPKVTDRDGCTPLYCAAAWNRIEAVRLLESLHCPSSLRSLEGRTPVHVAAEQGWVELVEVLVQELGNQVDARDNYQFTPLHSGEPRPCAGGHTHVLGPGWGG